MFGGLRGVGCQRELGECVEGSTDDVGHEGGDSACYYRGDEGGEEEKEELASRDEREEETDRRGWPVSGLLLWWRGRERLGISRRTRRSGAQRLGRLLKVDRRKVDG